MGACNALRCSRLPTSLRAPTKPCLCPCPCSFTHPRSYFSNSCSLDDWRAVALAAERIASGDVDVPDVMRGRDDNDEFVRLMPDREER